MAATEEVGYDVVLKDEQIEIRNYDNRVVAQTRVDGNLTEAGSKSFRPLFQYISGKNETGEKIEMTAPVIQAPDREAYESTVEASDTSSSTWLVSFLMPAKHSLNSLPAPTDSAVSLRKIAAASYAAIRYSGTWSEERYLENKEKLQQWILQRELKTTGPPIWARYNSPFTPWFIRRNEVLIPIENSNKT